MDARLRWALGLTLAAALVVLPFGYYRWSYAHGKRLRVVEPGRFYRSGQLTADGFRTAVATYHIRTVINAQDAYPDPDVRKHFFTTDTVKETELCREMGVRYIHLPPNLIPRPEVAKRRPEALDQFLDLLDDPANYPVLIHCQACLHRTGVLTAVYRMEYQGWSVGQAMTDLRGNGFDLWDSTAANDYINQYITTYRPGLRSHLQGQPK